MYAKLKFDPSTDFTKICRDVVRCIVNSDGAGGSTLAALEFVDANNSVIEDTVASNWSLAAGQTLGTGSSSVEQDKLMYLQQPHVSNATMTVAIGTVYEDPTSGVFTNANDATYGGMCLWPVSDYSESYEAIWGKPISTGSPSLNTSNWFRCTGPEIHIIAKDGCLTILGNKDNYLPGNSYMSIVEIDSYENRVGRNRAAMAWITGGNAFTSPYTSDAPTAINDLLNVNTIGVFTGDHIMPCNLQLVDALYDFNNNEEYRFVGFTHIYYTVDARSLATTVSYGMSPYGIKRDTSQVNGCNTQFLVSSTNDYEILTVVAGRSNNLWSIGANHANWIPSHSLVIENDAYTPRKTDGTPTIFMRPVMPVFGLMKSQFDLTTTAGFYHCTGNFAGNFNPDISDGTDTYVAFKLFATNPISTIGVAFKK